MFINVTIVEYSYICFEVFTKSQLQNFFFKFNVLPTTIFLWLND